MILGAHQNHLTGGSYGDGGRLGDLILVLKVVLHGLLFALNIGFQCGLHSVGLALGGLHDGYGVAAHHHGGNRGGKALVAAVLKAQQGEHDVLQLVVQLVIALVAILYSAVITAIIAFALEKTIGWRVTEAQEVGGIDLADQGERAYDFAGTASSVLKEVK